MNIPENILQELKCKKCKGYLSRSPVYQERDGGVVCWRCFTPESSAVRMTQYEATAKLSKFPCKNQELGCLVTVPYVGHDEVIPHEEICEFRRYVCPVLGSSACDWLGTRSELLNHCRDQHPENVLDNPTTFNHDITKSSSQAFILPAFEVLFLLHTKVCVESGKIFHSVRHLGTSDEAENFHFILDVKRGNEHLVKEGQVAPQGCLAIQEDTSLTLDTNGLLSVLGGFDGSTFSLMVKPKEICVGCGENSMIFYRDDLGCRCENCSPARRVCENQDKGCMYKDIPDKVLKHEAYFCQHGTVCKICKKKISPGSSLFAHYCSEHRDITQTTGSTWRPTTGETLFPIISIAGTALCWYRLDKSMIELTVLMPVPSEQLYKYRCKVQITDLVTKHKKAFTPDIVYKETWDWYIKLETEDFPLFSDAFDICVDICKI